MATLNSMPKRVVNWDVDEAVYEPVTPALPPPPTPVEAPRPVFEQAEKVMVYTNNPQERMLVEPRRRNRIGNGHKKEMVRKLINTERDYLRRAFIQKGGKLSEDDCVALKANIAAEVAIFQVTGFMSYLHREVAQGRIHLNDLPSYVQWMRLKYPNLWSQYNNPRFAEVRRRNEDAWSHNQTPVESIPLVEVPIQNFTTTQPNFKAFPRRGSYHRG